MLSVLRGDEQGTFYFDAAAGRMEHGRHGQCQPDQGADEAIAAQRLADHRFQSSRNERAR